MLWNRAAADLEQNPSIGWKGRGALALIGLAAIASTTLDKGAASVLLAITVMVGLLGAGVLFILRARTLEPDERRAWTLVGGGLTTAGLGVAVLAITWATSNTVGAFGPPDTLFLIGYVFGLSGFASLPHTYGSRLLRVRLLLDAVIGAVAVGSLLWSLFLSDVARVLSGAPAWERVVGSSYVFLDIALLVVLMIVVVKRSNLRFDLRLVLFGLGAVTQAVADIAFLMRGAGRSFAETEPFYGLHMIAVGFFLATALIVSRVPKEREYAVRTSPPTWAVVLPYGFAALMVSLLLSRFSTFEASPSDRWLMYATFLIGGLVITRQAVAIKENRRIVEDQRTDLVASISHELRTPLTAVVGFIEILDQGSLQDEAERREVTAIAAEQASYLSRIVSDLIMLASESHAAMDLDVAPAAVDELAWSSVNVAAIDRSMVRIDAESGVTAFLDSGRMIQALANFLTNAVRYGGEEILMIAAASGGDLVMEVHDNGPGVPRKYELMIWEKFERGPHRLNATVPGSGIGLAVANAIAKAHGGIAGYRRSERLGGACFWIRLPARVHVDEAPATDTEIGTPLTIVDIGPARSA